MILLSWIRFIPWYDIGDIMTGAACGAVNAYPSGEPDFTSVFHGGSCCPVICVSLFHVIVFFLSFEFFLFLLFDCLVSIYIFYLKLSFIVRFMRFRFNVYRFCFVCVLIVKNNDSLSVSTNLQLTISENDIVPKQHCTGTY